MALQEKLDKLREASKARLPPEARAVMERSIEDLRSSGFMTRIAAVGQKAPDFALPDDLRAIYLKLGIDLARGNGDGTW